MARGHRFSITFAGFVLVGWVGSIALTPQSWGAERNHIGVVLAVAGTAEVRALSTPQWEALRFRDHVFRNETIRTRKSSKVKLLMRNDSIMTLAENSEIHFNNFLLNDARHRSIISLIAGKIRVLTTKIFGRGDYMEVRTPNATAGVRGSEEHVSYDHISNRTTVFCVSGHCYIRRHDDSGLYLRIPEGHIAHHGGFQFPSATRQATEHERRAAVIGVALTEHDPREIITGAEPIEDRGAPPRRRSHGHDRHNGPPPGDHAPPHGYAPPPLLADGGLPTPPPPPPGSPPGPGLGPGADLSGSQTEIITPDTSPARPMSLIRLFITIPAPP